MKFLDPEGGSQKTTPVVVVLLLLEITSVERSAQVQYNYNTTAIQEFFPKNDPSPPGRHAAQLRCMITVSYEIIYT